MEGVLKAIRHLFEVVTQLVGKSLYSYNLTGFPFKPWFTVVYWTA